MQRTSWNSISAMEFFTVIYVRKTRGGILSRICILVQNREVGVGVVRGWFTTIGNPRQWSHSLAI